MALPQTASISPICSACFSSSMSPPSLRFVPVPPLVSLPNQQLRLRTYSLRRFRFFPGAMVQQVVPGAPANYAKEMERLSAKQSLLLAKIDLNERIICLERLNPTPRPTNSPYLEGRWNFVWFESGSPGLLAGKLIFEYFPTTVANLQKMDILIKDDYAKITTNTKLLNLLTVEGPLRMKEEYDTVVLESPKVDEGIIPDQLRGAFGQAVSTLQQHPLSLRDAVSSGLTIPLNGSFQRMFMISYVDEEILIIRDTSGVPEVLTRSEAPPSPMVEVEPATEYES